MSKIKDKNRILKQEEKNYRYTIEILQVQFQTRATE